MFGKVSSPHKILCQCAPWLVGSGRNSGLCPQIIYPMSSALNNSWDQTRRHRQRRRSALQASEQGHVLSISLVHLGRSSRVNSKGGWRITQEEICSVCMAVGRPPKKSFKDRRRQDRVSALDCFCCCAAAMNEVTHLRLSFGHLHTKKQRHEIEARVQTSAYEDPQQATFYRIDCSKHKALIVYALSLHYKVEGRFSTPTLLRQQRQGPRLPLAFFSTRPQAQPRSWPHESAGIIRNDWTARHAAREAIAIVSLGSGQIRDPLPWQASSRSSMTGCCAPSGTSAPLFTPTITTAATRLIHPRTDHDVE